MILLVKNGWLVDPGSDRCGRFDLVIEDGLVKQVIPVHADGIPDEAEDAAAGDVEIVDAAGKYILPGLIDLHVHFRDPGLTYKETIATGSRAAAHGGYTTVCTMPNTKPVMDSKETIEQQLAIIEKDAVIHVLPIGAVTKGQMGEELADIRGMKEAGACALSEDGKSVMNAALLAAALPIAKEVGLPFFDHCEDMNLVRGGVLHAGKKAEELGMKGITNSVEDVIATRDIILAKEAGAKLHLCHCSTADSVTYVRLAKEAGLAVSAEVCPHHFALCDEDIPGDDANYKMNPPLRSREDMMALREGIRDGIMEVISTDHAPHSAEEKAKSIKDAPFGIVGSETAFAIAYTTLVEGGYLDLPGLVKCMSLNPAKVLGIPKGTLQEGYAADFTIVDTNESYRIDPDTFFSKGKNTPFAGKEVRGKIYSTYVDGKCVYREDM